jgi:hypothetical protein
MDEVLKTIQAMDDFGLASYGKEIYDPNLRQLVRDACIMEMIRRRDSY